MLRLVLLASVLLGLPSVASAQTTPTDGAARTESTEEPDATRLDVERLPPEAIHITRDFYAHGFTIEALLGARGFLGGIGRISDPGLMLGGRASYEIFDWLWVGALFEMSVHQTDAPPPPGRSVFELIGAMGEVKLQVNPTAELGLWLSGQVGFIVATTPAPAVYGIQNAASVGIAYGGEIGVDAHFHSRHTSIGLLGGVRLAPSLDGFGETAIGVYGGPYLRYVF
ncbi:MAG: hypothetical protein U0234_08460 [Sandaracinus sp.]